MKTVPGWYPIVLVPALITKFCAENPVPQTKDNSCWLPSAPPSPINSPELSDVPHSTNPRYAWVLLIWLASVAVVLFINWTTGMSAVAIWGSLGCSTFSSACLICYLYLDHKHRAARQAVIQKRRLLDTECQVSEYKRHQSLASQSRTVDERKYRQELSDRHNRLRALLLERVQLPSTRESTAQQGASERTFYCCLVRYFPHVSLGGDFPIPDSSFHYSADFVLYHKPAGLAFDIEIDEPYVGNTGLPHHCSDDPRDNRRNQFFLERNWIVIRFAEWQVVNYPVSCCKLIASAIAQVTGDRSILAPFEDVADLPPHKQWTTKEAKRMVKKKYRDTYLPSSKFSLISKPSAFNSVSSKSNFLRKKH